MTTLSPAHSSIELDRLASPTDTHANNGAGPAKSSPASSPKDSPTTSRIATPLAGLSQRASSPAPSARPGRRTSAPASPASDAPRASGTVDAAHTRASAERASMPGTYAHDIDEIHSPATARATTPVDLPRLQRALDGQKNRDVDLEKLARVLQRVRFNPLHRSDPNPPSSHKELVRHISDETLQDWYTALSVTPDQVRGMESAAYRAGLQIPSSSTIFNIVSYIATPLAFAHARNPWHSVIASLLLAAFQPLVTAPVQSLVIGSIDYRRRLNHGEIKLDKTTVNSSTTQAKIKQKIDAGMEAVRKSEAAVAELFARHGLVAADGTIDPAKIDACSLSNAEKDALSNTCKEHLAQLVTLCTLTDQMQALDGAHERQRESTYWQIAPRTVRSGSGIVAPFIRKPAADVADSWVGKVFPYKASRYGVTGVSVFIAATALIAQHFAAAKDEVNGLKLEHKLNMLHADLFEDGKADILHRRGTITAADLSIEKCRNMVVSAEANIVQRVADRLDARLSKLRNERRNEQQMQRTRPVTPEELEEGRGMRTHELDATIAAYERDVANLRRLIVTDNLHEDTRALLGDALNGSHAFAWEEAVAKLTKPLEFTSQVSQRLGQTFTLGVAGSAGALAGGRVVSAALKGSDHIPLHFQLVLALASALIGFIAASTQGMVTNIKNRRREADPDEGAMSFGEQTLRGVGAPIEWIGNSVASRRAIADASQVIAELQPQARQMAASLSRLLTPTPDGPREP
ncbi:hypothetical protein LL998_28710 [Burkholderia ambifaria]|uniref:hypothetical protein n=1 Tax=Burkholderia ambifaria TaxID=152480 RepID=UPI001E65DB89|nr:hypothetical protein [Burkholderia ambifaria]UEP39232.1 hypothetical protein LL998_28710 [Burkholderia ambifaria]